MSLDRLEVISNSSDSNIADIIESPVVQASSSELTHERRSLASNCWSMEPTILCAPIEYNYDDYYDELNSFLPDEVQDITSCGMSGDSTQESPASYAYPTLPVEDINQITRMSDLAYVTRVETKYPWFRDLVDENDIIVTLRHDEQMCVAYHDIRYVESFLFRMQHEDDAQRSYIENRDAPLFHSVAYTIYRLNAVERATVFYLIQCNRCSNELLVAFLNMKLHQLSAFTFELIRRGESMNEVVEWYVDEYVDVIEMHNIDDVISKIAECDMSLSLEVKKRWERKYMFLASKRQKLIDYCVDEDAISARTKQDKEMKFYHKIAREINAIDYALGLCINSQTICYTFCKPVHLLQLSETAYTMTTPTLRSEIQRKIDVLSLLITEHNMRAQHNSLLLNENFYHLAIENTILTSELLKVHLLYDAQELPIVDHAQVREDKLFAAIQYHTF